MGDTPDTIQEIRKALQRLWGFSETKIMKKQLPLRKIASIYSL